MASRRGVIILLRSLRRRPYLMPPLCSVTSTAHLCQTIRSTSKPMAESFEFQAETKNLLDIVAKSLYSDQEVNFLLRSERFLSIFSLNNSILLCISV